MKEISELVLPPDVKYTREHEWAKAFGANLRVGIDDYAQDQLGDIVFVELPEVGAVFAEGEEFGSVESVKAVSELYMPVGGEVIAVNDQLADAPDLVNASPYEEGWMIEIQPQDPSAINQLLDKDAYLQQLTGKA